MIDSPERRRQSLYLNEILHRPREPANLGRPFGPAAQRDVKIARKVVYSELDTSPKRRRTPWHRLYALNRVAVYYEVRV